MILCCLALIDFETLIAAADVSSALLAKLSVLSTPHDPSSPWSGGRLLLQTTSEIVLLVPATQTATDGALMATLRREVADVEAELRLDVPLIVGLHVGREWSGNATGHC